MKRNVKKLLAMLCAVSLLFISSIIAFAEDANADGYNDGDVAAINAIISASETLSQKYSLDDPAGWGAPQNGGWTFINWSYDGAEYRVVYLDLSYVDDEDMWSRIEDFEGVLDVSALDELNTLLCKGSKNLTEIKLPSDNIFNYLSCSDTGIKELDVTGYPNLQVLDCDNTGIKKLDVSQNPLLSTLYCNNTAIKKLDVSANPALYSLCCSGTKLKSLDVSNCTGLTYLDCSDTDIAELKLPASENLSTLNCSYTKISKLDVSKNTGLTELLCENTEISELDVSKNKALYNFYCGNTKISKLDVSKNKELLYLGVGNTNIKEIDLSKNTALQALYCERTKLTALDISKNKKLTILDCGLTEIESLDISKNKMLSSLMIYDSKIKVLDASKNENIDYLDMGASVKQLITPKGDIVTIEQSLGGEIYASANLIENTVSFNAFSDTFYEFTKWNGLPKKATVDENIAGFSIKGDVTVSAEFGLNKDMVLSSLGIDDVRLSPKFKYDTLNYTATVDYGMDKINLTAKTKNPYLMVTGTGVKDLKVGENTFKVILSDYDEFYMFDDELEYTVTVTRLPAPVVEDTDDSTVQDSNESEQIPADKAPQEPDDIPVDTVPQESVEMVSPNTSDNTTVWHAMVVVFAMAVSIGCGIVLCHKRVR